MRQFRILYAIMATAAATVLTNETVAQSVSLLHDVQRTALPVYTFADGLYLSNPAAMSYRDSVSLSSFNLNGNYLDMEKAVMEQTGTGHSLFTVEADSYMRLKTDGVAWGNARFTTGQYRDIRWTDCIDYERVAPYVLGDAVGGNLSNRQYAFSGGYSGRKDRWTFGAHASYRAEVAYRNRDPRVKTIVSDLDINLGASFRVLAHHAVGLMGGINVYNQNCDLDFYNPINDIDTYTLTGLGTYYKRFMGNTNKNSGYSSIGFSVGAQWIPTRRKGLSGSVTYTRYRMEQQLRNFNNLTLGYSDNNLLNVSVGYTIGISRSVTLSPMLTGNLHSRTSTENLFGTSAGASYDKIGSRTPYTHDISDLSLTCPVQLNWGQSYLTLTPQVKYDYDHERYKDPVRDLKVSHVTPGLQLDFSSITHGKWLWNGRLGGSYSIASPSTPVLTELEMDSELAKCVMSNFEMLSADRMALNAGIGASRIINGIVFSLSLDYALCDYRDNGLSQGAAVTLGAKF